MRESPKMMKVGKCIDELNLIVHGQGVIVFESSDCCSLSFLDNTNSTALRIYFTDTSVYANMEPSNEPLIDKTNSKGIMKNVKGAYYWVSIDSQNQRICAGIGEARQENIIYFYKFPENSKMFLESLVKVNAYKVKITYILRDPITKLVPLLVKNTSELTMEAIALGTYMPKANLSLVSQKLYDCIAGNQFILDTSDFPEFTKAIEYSIATPGKWCYECLKAKATEFDKDKPNDKETYLRITLGENNGESPGEKIKNL